MKSVGRLVWCVALLCAVTSWGLEASLDGGWRLRALDTAGRPIGDVPVAPDGVAQLSVINAFGQTMQYELTLEPSLK